MRKAHQQGFTLIELSIVLVIIGLIVGGVLVGQSLINAAAVRATISQIEKYNTAVNTFRDKYGGLPGDLNAATAAQFGFVARGPNPGEGDGNGVIESNGIGYGEGYGETVVFWVDLTAANLIEGGFTTAISTPGPGVITATTTPSLNAFLPLAKLGGGNYVYVWSGGVNTKDGKNYFGIASIAQIAGGWEVLGQGGGRPQSIHVTDAYAIDAKMDDGFPFSGRVTTAELWGSPQYATNSVGAGTATSCSDNPSGFPAAQLYAMDINQGAGANCALSFQFQ